MEGHSSSTCKVFDFGVKLGCWSAECKVWVLWRVVWLCSWSLAGGYSVCSWCAGTESVPWMDQWISGQCLYMDLHCHPHTGNKSSSRACRVNNRQCLLNISKAWCNYYILIIFDNVVLLNQWLVGFVRMSCRMMLRREKSFLISCSLVRSGQMCSD